MTITDVHAPGDVRAFDRLAPLYDRVMPATDPEALRAGLGRADRQIDRGLDVAGGSGRAARAVEGVDWTVVDAAPGMLRAARRRGHAAIRGDATDLPVRSDAVDAVVILDALHHVGAADRALREAARVLRPGGVLVVREFDPGTVRGRALVAAEHLVGFDSTFHRPDDLAAMVADAGLSSAVTGRGFDYTVVGLA